MPLRKMTKAMLEAENKRLRQQRDQARKELAREKKTGASSISRSHSQLELTCSAMQLVTQWERDPKMEEKDKLIADMRAEIEKKNKEIIALRRGEGPIGEVLLYVEGRGLVSEERREALLAKRSPVWHAFAALHTATGSMRRALALPM
jgi:hypothetical protein